MSAIVEVPMQSGSVIHIIEPQQIPLSCYVPLNHFPTRRAPDGATNYIPRNHLVKSPYAPHEFLLPTQLRAIIKGSANTIVLQFLDTLDNCVVMELTEQDLPPNGIDILTTNINNSRLIASTLRRR